MVSQRLFSREYVVKVLILFAAYFITAKYGLQLGAVSGFATLVWPPTGIAFAALLLFNYRLWPGIFLGAFFVNHFSQGAPILVALAIGAGNTLEAVIGVYLLKRVVKFRNSFDRLSDVFGFVGVAVLLATLISPTIGVISLMLAGIVSLATIFQTWVAWWVGDALGALIMTPFLLLLFKKESYDKKVILPRLVEGLGFVIAFTMVSWVVFFDLFGVIATNPSLLYLIFPLLIVIAFRFGAGGASVSTLATSVVAIWGTALGVGPFIFGNLSHNLLLLQVFIGSVSVTSLILSSAIAERKKANETLLEQKEKDEALLQSIGEGVIAVDTAGRIILYNKAAENMLHVPSSQAINSRYDSILRLEDEQGHLIPTAQQPLAQVLTADKKSKDNHVSNSNYYHSRNDGTRFPLIMTVSPIFMHKRIVGAINVFRDVTREKEIDKAKSEFVSIASHQLRTPLTIIQWYTELLVSQRNGPLNAKQQEDLSRIIRGSHRMVQLVNNLLNVSRVGSGRLAIEPQTTNLVTFMQQLITELLPQAKQVQCNFVVAEHVQEAIVGIDRLLLQQVIHNLLTNAIKYRSPERTCYIEITLTRDAEQQFVLTIQDNGVGIPHGQQHRVFDRFFRARNVATLDTEGTGLGLYVSKMLLDAAGCRITFTSQEGHGTTFRITIPLTGMRRKSGEIGLAGKHTSLDNPEP